MSKKEKPKQLTLVRKGIHYYWNGFPFNSDPVSITLNTRDIRSKEALKKGITKLMPGKTHAKKREELFNAIRALDTFSGTEHDLQVIKEFALHQGIKVSVERQA